MYCTVCGYTLVGLPQGRCPECGRAFDPADGSTFERSLHPGWPWMVRASSVFSLLPFGALGLFYGTWLAAAISLGHWPIPSFDDPKAINGFVSLLRNVTWIALLVAILTPAARVVMLIIESSLSTYSRKKIGRASNIPFAVECFGWLMIGSALLIDPGNVLLWFMD